MKKGEVLGPKSEDFFETPSNIVKKFDTLGPLKLSF
jgi:hypothetical protein